MRKCLLAGLAFVLMIAGVLIALVRPIHCPVNRAAFERIEEGMTQAEIHEILGGPPGEYQTQPGSPMNSDDGEVFWGIHREKKWIGDEGTVNITYRHRPSGSGSTTVKFVSFEEAEPYNPRPVELIRWRLERLKERWLP